MSIAIKCCKKANKVSPQDFHTECDKSVGTHIGVISKCFSKLEVDKKSVVVTPRVAPTAVTNLYDVLADTIDTSHSPAIHLAADLKQIPKLGKFMDVHVIIQCILSIQ